MATFKGTITNALPEQSGTSKSGKAWRKREYIVEYEHGQYPKSVVFSVMGQKIDELNIQQGVEYEVEVDFAVREYQGKYCMSASAWKAAPTQPMGQPAPQQPVYQQAQPQYAQAAPPAQDDGLPF